MQTIELSLAALLSILVVMRATIPDRHVSVPFGVGLILSWLAVVAGVAGMTLTHAWITILLYLAAAVGGCALILDWEQLGQARMDVAHYQDVVRRQAESESEHDHEAGTVERGHVASVGHGGKNDDH